MTKLEFSKLLNDIETKLERALDGTYDDEAIGIIYDIKKDIEEIKTNNNLG